VDLVSHVSIDEELPWYKSESLLFHPRYVTAFLLLLGLLLWSLFRFDAAQALSSPNDFAFKTLTHDPLGNFSRDTDGSAKAPDRDSALHYPGPNTFGRNAQYFCKFFRSKKLF
jgi:hypothetical protein